eukprot:1008532-Prorocentrum_minimum.AAC.3
MVLVPNACRCGVGWQNHDSETNIDDVLQTETVFTNVSKGILAKSEDLEQVFGTTIQLDICKKVRVALWDLGGSREVSTIDSVVPLNSERGSSGLGTLRGSSTRNPGVQLNLILPGRWKPCQILADGEVQISDKERAQQFENSFRDVVNVLVEKTINPETSRPYPPGMIEKSLHDLHFAVDITRPAKVQALDMLPKLQTRMPIKRADMRLRIQDSDGGDAGHIWVANETGPTDFEPPSSTHELRCLAVLGLWAVLNVVVDHLCYDQVPSADGDKLFAKLKELKAKVESSSSSKSECTVVCSIEPGGFRKYVLQYLSTFSGNVSYSTRRHIACCVRFLCEQSAVHQAHRCTDSRVYFLGFRFASHPNSEFAPVWIPSASI